MRLMSVKFDNTISSGTIIQLIVLLMTLYTLSNNFEHRMTALEVKVDKLWMVSGR